ncbi:MAG: peptidoglycan DD-metalloendopeptidase family protein [Bdellovibrionota bacterium]
MIDFSQFTFHPVIHLPPDYEIFDFTQSYDPFRTLKSAFGIGRYNEKRPGMYNTDIFKEHGSQRDIHMGIDIGAPIGTEVFSFWGGEIFLTGYNGAEGDYGNTVIVKHTLAGTDLYALYGHLSQASIEGKKPGQKISKGEVIAWVGDKHENGGWNPHLHFQLSYERPEKCDMPGVVKDSDRAEALRIFPDPRLVLGAIY